MGTDFMEKVKKPFRKHLDLQRAKLKTNDLFTVQPELVGRILRAEPIQDGSAQIGDKVVVEPETGCLVARKGMTVVGKIANPPKGVLEKLDSAGSVLPAQVAEVNEVCGTLGLAIDA